MASTRFNRIITHVWPHLDEIFAIRLLRKHGEKQFPGISQCRVEYCGTGEAPEGLSSEEHLAKGTILVGTGGGMFDEHPTSQGAERKKDHSACSLVAQALGLEKHPVYKQLIHLVTEADQTGVHQLHIANRLKTRYRLFPEEPERAIDLAQDFIDDFLSEQELFLAAQRELQSLHGTEAHFKLIGPCNELDAVVVKSDNFKLAAAARSLNIAVLIQVQPSGHIQIFTDIERHNLSFRHVVAQWRQAEMLATGSSKAKVAALDQGYLEREGKIAEVTNLFYQNPGENLLNGSETTPDTPPTKVPLTKIVKFVKNFTFAESAVMA